MIIATIIEMEWVGEFVSNELLKDKLLEMNLTNVELWDMVYEKLQPIIDKAKVEFEKTEEYITRCKNEEVLKAYMDKKDKFQEKYGSRAYDRCYDIFGVLRNEEYLKKLKKKNKSGNGYGGNSSYGEKNYSNYGGYYENNSGTYSEGSSSYSDEDYSSYSNEDFSSYSKKLRSNYSEEDKEGLKKLYKVLALHFHPDRSVDNGEMMKLVNRLKEDWRI